jgi:hypothetical protein
MQFDKKGRKAISGSYAVSVTSQKNPRAIMSEVHRALLGNRVATTSITASHVRKSASNSCSTHRDICFLKFSFCA